ncbi:Gmad2 immunoglobulin-like domain-containing protein [Dethiobacter alkaliphilus]|uniref:Gmad2 immunoglobulin-like domain-containing protein n=1 Tax=Dethiobacter alkaliphilus TaxID=427926 RepID=UPI0022267174|nr:Gmad2 immunoglobulin-like domain-containing protein [Dethiobacter alkaliphilus]MCW3491446.1 protease complex subunit PrcB family protein [Dethiobacter alkaliphilus]
MLRKRLVLLLTLLLGIVLITGCAENGDMSSRNNSLNGNDAVGEYENGENNDVDEPSAEEIIDDWLEYSRGMFLGQSRELDGMQYLLVTYGQKESDGYNVEIIDVDVDEEDEKVYVEVKFTAPDEDKDINAEETYLYALEMIEATGLPVEFKAVGDEDFVPQLLDIDYLQPIAADSAHIKIFSPGPGEQVGHRFKVEGIINEHEGNVQYRLMDGSGTVLISGVTGMNASRDWKYFSLNVVVDSEVVAEETLLMEINTQSAQNGDVQDTVRVEFVLQE